MHVEYVDSMGTDLRVADAARVSFRKRSALVEGMLSGQDERLLDFLARENHWTPFSHCVVTMVESVPIFVARQRFKHMVGFTYNEVSRRYVDDKPEFYIPSEWRGRPVHRKQGSSDEVIKSLDWQFDSEIKLSRGPDVDKAYKEFIEYAERYYTVLIANGVAPEQARMVLPQSMMTEYFCTGSLYAWARAYLLRIDPHAQKEIQDLAVQWDKVIRPLYPVAWSKLVDWKQNP